ncbi:MAG TPA: serine/threonine protein phosphatase [Smithella sp.]|jgi:serine/threonine protein phosphatase 1|nr:serine/threonine protein phosphatase [Smithella sp.]
MNKIFAIGDIHGCLEKLKELMSRIDIDSQNDTLIFIGDYIDRGRFGREVVDYVIRLKGEYKNTICLLGNHEYMFARYLECVDEDIYLGNGGINTLQSYGIFLSDDAEERKRKIPEKHRQFFESLLPYYETEDYIFVHAGFRTGLPLKEQTIDDLLWIRYKFIESEHDFDKIVVFGHTPLTNPLIDKNKIGIDTGAVYGGKLTCVELPEVKIYQV